MLFGTATGNGTITYNPEMLNRSFAPNTTVTYTIERLETTLSPALAGIVRRFERDGISHQIQYDDRIRAFKLK